MAKYKLLINDSSLHDSDVALIDDEKIVCVLETERVSKHKHAMYERADACVDYIKKQYNLKDEDVEVVSDANCRYTQHHELHAMASYLSSGYDKASILVIDGSGDQNDCVTLFSARGYDLYELKKYDFKYSLGALYDVASMLVYDDAPNSEGKLMGLSCCAEPEYSIPSPIQYHEDGTVELNIYEEDKNLTIGEALSNYIRKKFIYLLKKDGFDGVMGADVYKAKIAATAQWWFTEQVVNLVKYLKSLSPKMENLCVCGGCFLNCETNGVIDRLNLFKNIYCVSGPADNSIVIGRAQQVLIENGAKPTILNSAYLGPKQDSDFPKIAEAFNIIEHLSGRWSSDIIGAHDLTKYSEEWVIERLKGNKPILWFDGESEFGPRALGHRSFLANPATNEMFWQLSVGIKQRENYRPLAPITTAELYDDIFDDPHPENLTQFMLKTVKVKEKWHDKLKAVIHVNQTARPQRLTKEVNPALHSLIMKWYEETGLPCLINTSLNLKNQPLLENFDDLKSLFVNPNICGKCSVVINHLVCFDM